MELFGETPYKPQMGKVYLISNGTGHYKIGYTKRDPQKRVDELQTGSSYEIFLVQFFESTKSQEIEKIMHRKYSMLKTQGEWFDLPLNEVLAFKEECRKIEKNLVYLEKNRI